VNLPELWSSTLSGKKSGAHAPQRIFALDKAFDLIDGAPARLLEIDAGKARAWVVLSTLDHPSGLLKLEWMTTPPIVVSLKFAEQFAKSKRPDKQIRRG
jgi:hypothetical protein